MKRVFVILCAALFIFGVAELAEAYPITAEFVFTVTYSKGYDVAANETGTGYFIYDSETPDNVANEWTGHYWGEASTIGWSYERVDIPTPNGLLIFNPDMQGGGLLIQGNTGKIIGMLIPNSVGGGLIVNPQSGRPIGSFNQDSIEIDGMAIWVP